MSGVKRVRTAAGGSLHASVSILLAIASCLLVERNACAEKARVPASRFKLVVGGDTTFITEPLSAEGYPDYLAALNLAAGRNVARDDNFWVKFFEVTGRRRDVNDEFVAAVSEQLQIRIPDHFQIKALHEGVGVAKNDVSELYKRLEWTMVHPWTPQDAPAVNQWLIEHADVMKGIREAARRPQAYCPLVRVGPPDVLNVRLAHLEQCRVTTWLFLARAMRRVKAGEDRDSFEDLLTIYQMAKHLERGALPIQRVVAIQHRKAAHAGLGCWLTRNRLSDKELQERWEELTPLMTNSGVEDFVTAGRFEFLDTAFALASGTASYEDLFPPTQPTPPPQGVWLQRILQTLARAAVRKLLTRIYAPRDLNAVVRYGNDRFDAVAEAMSRRNLRERTARCAAIEESIHQDQERLRNPFILLRSFLFAPRGQSDLIPARMLTYVLVPSLLEAERQLSDDEARSACVTAAFQLQIDIAVRGASPSPLEERIRSDRFPKDPYTDVPLKIRKEERGIVIYSVGANGKDDSADDEDIEADDIRFTLGVEED